MAITNATEPNTAETVRQKIAVLGSTGSIGCQTLDIVRAFPDRFQVRVLSSNSRWDELARQAAEFLPEYAVIADRRYKEKLTAALDGLPVKVLAGAEDLARATGQCDAGTVVNALVGFSGLMPTVHALRSGKKLALANKESLVVAGEYVMQLAEENATEIIPIDSEHSAILQCLAGEPGKVKKIILTASGGALRNVPLEELDCVTVEQALAHPNWEMGAKITIDSATMVNKGFEVIEARWLFGLDAKKIEVVIHPQSVVHSMVEFEDGAVKAQLGTPDMHLPIQYALSYPDRWNMACGGNFDITECVNLEFSKPDPGRYPALATAYEVLRTGGDRGCVFNAANEAAVAAFLAGRLSFTAIRRTIEHCLDTLSYGGLPAVEEITDLHMEVTRRAEAFLADL
ncbi:MAG: 1-deoxy-D-xylulose-5-phosphate reductoisomerase [Alistipes sp.]|nr:1-deoxy-D-xylulose-5-phosphate reductoisomerase [Alistipes sp.]